MQRLQPLNLSPKLQFSYFFLSAFRATHEASTRVSMPTADEGVPLDVHA